MCFGAHWPVEDFKARFLPLTLRFAPPFFRDQGIVVILGLGLELELGLDLNFSFFFNSLTTLGNLPFPLEANGPKT